jgi:hypothetical protein
MVDGTTPTIGSALLSTTAGDGDESGKNVHVDRPCGRVYCDEFDASLKGANSRSDT